MKICWKHAVAFGLLACTAAAQAQTNPFAKGPDPTLAGIRGNGPFAISSQVVARQAGIGGATVFSPNTPGTYALIALCPGFTEGEPSVTPIGMQLATHGFVVAAMTTVTRLDLPPSRATQLLATLDIVRALNTGPVAGKIDINRVVVGGHSMGGGGTLGASVTRPGILAGLPFAPFSVDKSFATSVPQFIFGGQNDNIANPDNHAIMFYEQLTDSTPKVYVELTGQNHFFVNNNVAPSAQFAIAWAKRFADNDRRYEQFITAGAVQAEMAAGRLVAIRRESVPF